MAFPKSFEGPLLDEIGSGGFGTTVEMKVYKTGAAIDLSWGYRLI